MKIEQCRVCGHIPTSTTLDGVCMWCRKNDYTEESYDEEHVEVEQDG